MSKCPIFTTYCDAHAFTHGAEAEELRESIENIIQDFDSPCHSMDIITALRRVLDRVDARDSLAYVEARNAMNTEIENDH